MSFQHKTATLFAVLLTTTLLSSCVGLGVAIPHTRHETLSPNDYVNKQNMVRSRADIINRHGEPDTFQIRTVDDIERVTIDTGRRSCGVLLVVLPVFPKLCKTRMQYDLRGDKVVATHERRTRFYGYVCSVILPIMGKDSLCAFLKM